IFAWHCAAGDSRMHDWEITVWRPLLRVLGALDCPLHEAIADALLLEPDALTEPVMAQVVEQLALISREPVRLARISILRRLADPQVPVRHQRLPVHQQGAGVRKRLTQPVQDAEAMGIDVAPVP